MNYATQSVEANYNKNGAADPYLEFGEIIDLHPVFAAMALAREVADANGTEQADVSWDPAWPDLEVDNDEYWNDLTERNWTTLSRWNAMVLAAEGKILHMKVRDGVETVTVITPMPESGMAIVEYAVWYANHGLPVFPCDPADKSPLVSSGFKAATTDEDRIRAWWRRWPATQPIGSPSNAIEPAAASVTRSHGSAVKLRWVSIRW